MGIWYIRDLTVMLSNSLQEFLFFGSGDAYHAIVAHHYVSPTALHVLFDLIQVDQVRLVHPQKLGVAQQVLVFL